MFGYDKYANGVIVANVQIGKVKESFHTKLRFFTDSLGYIDNVTRAKSCDWKSPTSSLVDGYVYQQGTKSKKTTTLNGGGWDMYVDRSYSTKSRSPSSRYISFNFAAYADDLIGRLTDLTI